MNDPFGDGQPISAAVDLQPDIIYCETEDVFDYINQKRASLMLDIPTRITTKLVSHSLSFRLLHHHGPYRKYGRTNVVLIANCLHDETRSVLISLQILDNEEILFDQHIHQMFTLKNFMTLKSHDFTFNSENVDCHIVEKSLHKFMIIASTELRTVLKFEEENSADSLNCQRGNFLLSQVLESESPNDATEDAQEDWASISKVPNSELAQSLSNSVINDDPVPVNQPIIIADETIAASHLDNSKYLRLENISVSSAPKRKQPDLENLSAISDNCLLAPERDPNSENCDPNSEQASLAILSQSSSILSLVDEILNEIPQGLVQRYRVESYIRDHLGLIDNSTCDLTKLNQVIHPSNNAQTYNFANIVGIIKKANKSSGGKRMQLIISDEETEEFCVQLGMCDIEKVKKNPNQAVPGSHALFFSEEFSSHHYPVLENGNLICIRDLCLAEKSTNICSHPNQLVEIQSFAHHVSGSTTRKLSKDELKRTIELMCQFADTFVQNPIPYKVNQYNIIDFCGQFIAKKTVKERTELFLLMPYEVTAPSYLLDDASFIMDFIERMAPPSDQKNFFDQVLIETLINKNRIVKMTIYGWHHFIDSCTCFDVLIFFNVQVKHDLIFEGFTRYLFHEGIDFGRRCTLVMPHTILGGKVLSLSDTFLKESKYRLEENMTPHLDDAIICRMPSTSIASRIRSIEKNANEADVHDSWKPILLQRMENPNHNQELALLRPYTNINLAQKVDSFLEIHQHLASASNDSLRKLYFRISARVIDYLFESENGLPIREMAGFRDSLVKFLCTNRNCNYITSYNLMAPLICRTIASSINDRPMPCLACTSGSMEVLLTLQMAIEDRQQQTLYVKVTSPEVEDVTGVTRKQLIFADQCSDDICKAVEHLLKIFCPYRKCLANPKQPELENKLFDWIIQCVPSNESLQAKSHYSNSRLGRNQQDGPVLYDFYIRGIFEIAAKANDELGNLNISDLSHKC